jgi:hypothetical protein
MRRILSLVGLAAALGGGFAEAQSPAAAPAPPGPVQVGLGETTPNPSVEAFKSICLVARAEPAATAKAALAAHWSPIPSLAIPAMGGTAFEDALGYTAPADTHGAGPRIGGAAQGVWVIIGRTPMPGFSYLADSCAVFAAPADASLAQAVRAWAGGAPTVDDPSQQLIQYAFAEAGASAQGAAGPGSAPGTRTLTTDTIEAAAPGLQAGAMSLVTVVPGTKRSVLVYSVVNP